MRHTTLAVSILMLLAAIPAAHAGYLSPVAVVKDAPSCRTLAMLQHREQLAGSRRLENLQGMQTTDAFTGECNTIPAGRLMYFEGYKGKYACLRFRPFSDCRWLRRNAIGEVFEVYPGRTLEQSSKGVSCDAWAKVIRQADVNIEAARKQAYAGSPNNAAERLAQGMLHGTLNMFTGSATLGDRSKFRMCFFNFRYLQERARQLVGYDWCPKLDTSGQRQKLRADYEANLRAAQECSE